uniref:NADH-ubiquinone oxidoreductase chain 3 n=1 Tax=Notochthamalus scabrosus TaxID=261896 RepID=U5LTW0_NOTSA|nr:NADH dehydrogenase subunit 3 [Notochthamalus scabrosus]AGX31554.1 NADH dehydrogenase subunit 3 [Notochthamalus scabrosus]AGX31567.1 NADH dehydrogenase subunit 3 [Notochthamalus scabrosus]AGX31580.1 NADH dehydrogenase subunit 3 [Notochthamalus scabrosus]AGX31593.1 NADH dehydrogenase subunit 3 [Notochthamalus scabrosus]
MKILMFSFCISVLISSALILVSTLFSKKTVLDREKTSPFECGFDPKNTSRIPFSIRFFLIAIVFLIFDIEISILLPLGLISNSIPPLIWMTTGGLFLLVVTVGLYYEWKESTLDWIT